MDADMAFIQVPRYRCRRNVASGELSFANKGGYAGSLRLIVLSGDVQQTSVNNVNDLFDDGIELG